MAKEVVRQYLPLLEEEGRGAATDDAVGRDRHYLPDTPEEDPYQAGHRTCAGCGRRSAQAELQRFHQEDGVLVAGAGAGRGVYTCRRLACFDERDLSTERGDQPRQ